MHCGLICILFLSQSCGIISQSITSRSNYDCGFFTVQFVRVPFSIGVHVHVVNKAAETQSTDRSVQTLVLIHVKFNITAESPAASQCKYALLLPATPDTWVYFLPVDVSGFSWALCSNNSPVADTPQLRLQQFVPLVMGCITSQHMVWTQVGQLSKKHACWWIRDDVLNGDMESAYVMLRMGTYYIYCKIQHQFTTWRYRNNNMP